MEDKQISEQESLRLITEMIQKVKHDNFHESGTSSILWGSVVALAGIMNFAEAYFHFNTGFNWWSLTAFAILPQIWIAIKEAKSRVVVSHQEIVLNAVWLVFGCTLVGLSLFANLIPFTADKLLTAAHLEILQHNTETGVTEKIMPFTPSILSVFLLVYAFPTLVTGLVHRFQPMIIGAILCYAFFVISLFTNYMYDALLSALAAIGNWLVPGIILRSIFLKVRKVKHV